MVDFNPRAKPPPLNRWQAINHGDPQRRVENEIRIGRWSIRLAVLNVNAVLAPSTSVMLMEWMTPPASTPSTIFSTRSLHSLGHTRELQPVGRWWRGLSPSSSFCSCVWPSRNRSGERRSSNCAADHALHLRIPRGIEPGILAIEQKNLARRIGVAPVHLPWFAQQQRAALFPVDAHSVKAFGEGDPQGMQAVVVLVHPLRQLLRGQLLGAQARGQRQRKQQQTAREAPSSMRMDYDRLYWIGWVQFVPPAMSALISPAWSMQKPRWPDLPTDCGTAVAS